ncbi:Transmembrane protein 43-like protein [Diplonema papillatum]|nr:Transmembrane protein 43-like protein [Diplonema papillatum]
MSVRYQTGPHSMTEVSHQGFGSRVAGGACGTCFGVLLAFGATGLLWWNEGNAVATYKELVFLRDEVVELGETPVPDDAIASLAGRPVHLFGEIEGGVITDDTGVFKLTTQSVALRRSVQMYQWKEQSRSRTEKHVGGSTTTVTDTDYYLGWYNMLQDSRRFKMPMGHENPPRMMPGAFTTAPRVRMGNIRPGNEVLAQLPLQPLTIRQSDVQLQQQGRVAHDHVYLNAGGPEPQVGDQMVSYVHFPHKGIASVVGILQHDGTITGAPSSVLPLVAGGFATHVQMIDAAITSSQYLTWGLRLLGFLLMWAAVGICIEPLNIVADVVPFVGSIVRFFTGAAVWLLALVLSGSVISVAWLFARPLLSLSILAASAAIIFFARPPSGKQARFD